MTKIRYTQVYIGTLLLFALAMIMNIAPAASTLIIGLGIGVALLGLPHGALDFAVAKSLGLVDTIQSTGLFLSAYVVLAALSILFWLSFPATALSLFLCISVYHFCADWRTNMPKYASISLASIVVCGPALLYAPVVSTLFTALLLGEQSAEVVIMGMRGLFIAGAFGCLVFASKLLYRRNFEGAHTPRKWIMAEWLGLIISAVCVTPLLHFGLYFCLLHSPKHLHDVSLKLNISVKRALALSTPFVIATLVLALTIYYWATAYAEPINIDVAIVRWVFIGLFGLTMSHMILISFWHSRISLLTDKN